jgi:hypothetical protein
MATKTPSLSDLKKVSKVKEKAPSKSDIRVIDFTGTKSEAEIAKLCELAFLGNKFGPQIEQHKKAVACLFFDRWTQELFESRKVPGNFKARLKKKDGDKVTTFDDMACNFIMKFNTNGLAKKLPKPSELPPKADDPDETMTVHEVLIETLKSAVVGLTEDNAHKFAQEEFVVVESTELADGGLEKMLAAEEGSGLRAVGDFILKALLAESEKDLKKLKPLTDEQRSLATGIRQVYTIKDGVEERLLNYVENIDQLRNLMRFMSVTEQVSNFEFGISDEEKIRNQRITEIAGRYINIVEAA